MTDTPRPMPVSLSAAPEKPGGETKEAARRLREAEALRLNLRRRKEQARARAEPAGPAPQADAGNHPAPE